MCSVPLMDARVELAASLPYGFYALTISSDGVPFVRLKFAIELFSLPDAIETAREFLSRRQYVRAFAVLTDTTQRHPENPDVQDLLCVAHALIASDPKAYAREQEEFVVFRGSGEIAKQALRAFQNARSRFGERVGALIAGRTLDASAVSDEGLALSAEGIVSTAVLRSLILLKNQMEVAKSTPNEPLLRVLRFVAGRLEHLESFNSKLTSGLDAVRSDEQGTDDDKFALAEQLLHRYTEEIVQSRIVAPDYMPFFREQVGEACWNWVRVDVQRVFNTAENLYRYQAGKTAGASAVSADFTPPIIEICRGFEALLNDKLGRSCRSIQDAINMDSDCTDAVRREFPADTLKGVLKPERSMSMWKIATILRQGKLIEPARPGIFNPRLRALLAFSPGPADIEQVVFLSYIASVLRNGKVHSSEFTSPHGMRLARKLVLGLDEGRIGYGSIRDWIEKSWFKKDAGHVYKKLSTTWAEFPGILPTIFRAMGRTDAKTSTA
jgi:hypothetical protein